MFPKEAANRILVYGHPADLRKGFCGLEALVRQALREDPLSGDLFVFINSRGNLDGDVTRCLLVP
jgi:transposase